MKEATCRMMIEAKVIEDIVIRGLRSNHYEIWLHGENLPADMCQRLEVARGGPRMCSSVDSAWRIVRALGWRGPVTVEAEV